MDKEQQLVEAHIEQFVGENYAFYQRKWLKCTKNKHNPSSWNGAALFFGVFWMVYRKMYKYALIAFAVLLVEGVFEAMLNLPDAASYGITVTVALLFGFYGNALYQHHVNQKVYEITTSYPPEQVGEELKRQGGVSWFAALGLLAIPLLLMVVMIAYSR